MQLLKENTPRWIIFLIDISISIFSIVFAYLLRFNFDIPDTEIDLFYFNLVIFPVVRAGSFAVSKIYAGIIRYTSSKDAERIFTVNSITSVLFLLINLTSYLLNKTFIVPISILIIEYLITIFLMIAFRILVKVLYIEMNNPRSERTNTIIFGDGELAVIAKRSIDRDLKSKQNICAFISNDKKKIKQKLEGVYIYSIDNFEELLKKCNAKTLIFAKQNITPEIRNKLTDIALNHKLKVKTVPETSEWIDGELSVSQLKNIKIEQLLERPEIQLDKKNIETQISGKTILITGAAGSIGSEIVRQVSKFKPAIIVLFDQAESPMYDIELELKEEFKFTDYKIIIGDISNKDRVEYIISRYKPEIIFHAAAYKHVPMMEINPYEAVKTNIEGTRILAETADKYKVDRFVMVSTDKAVNPTNVMGASKRIAEIFVQSLNNHSSTKYITTRFGNVLGSNGSVIPRFRKQIENGGPVTVTHPEITRFFMTIPEACQLVLEAGTMGNGGEIYIFDMGKSVKIVDLAKKMIKLSGFEPGKDIEIKFTGLRPGEKLYEELLNNQENTMPTHHSKIMIAKVRKYQFDEINTEIKKLIEVSHNFDNYEIVLQMKQIVPEFISNNSVFEKLDNNGTDKHQQ